MALTIVGLGIGNADAITDKAKEALRNADSVFLQSKTLPQAQAIADWGVQAIALDDVYESAQDFDALSISIAQILLRDAEKKDICFAVAGHGLIGQSAAAAALKQAQEQGIETSVIAGISLPDAALAAAQIDASGGYDAIFGDVDIHRLNTNRTLVLCELDQPIMASNAKLALLERYDAEQTAYFVQLAQGSMRARQITLFELDRQVQYDYSTALVVPQVLGQKKERYTMDDLMDITRQLRAPGGCPWDRKQTHASLKPFLIEESCEVLSAIDEGDDYHLAEELGDVLLQVALHATIGSEHASFTILDATSGICQKMIRRHPHVFADVQADTPEEVLINWEQIKQQEKGNMPQMRGLLDGVGKGMPPLLAAQQVQQKAKTIGFDWDDYAPALDKVAEETGELIEQVQLNNDSGMAEEAGDLLFAAVNAIRLLGLDASTVLYGAIEKFKRRFAAMEEYALSHGMDLGAKTLEELDKIWEKVKEQ
ncbi:nucleoside triphosphate pyrophosphohydrolase [Eubacteriales bacterium OttesenSCG-928-N14]|nr:nucleoside triphosphate pyrophosphohydrolase [Eubacteriales bacterium OttesenSCG-928-N14]